MIFEYFKSKGAPNIFDIFVRFVPISPSPNFTLFNYAGKRFLHVNQICDRWTAYLHLQHYTVKSAHYVGLMSLSPGEASFPAYGIAS